MRRRLYFILPDVEAHSAPRMTRCSRASTDKSDIAHGAAVGLALGG